jgi:hypothetical protein
LEPILRLYPLQNRLGTLEEGCLPQLQLRSQTQHRFALPGADIVGTFAVTVFTKSQKVKLSNGYSFFAFMLFFFVPISFFSFVQVGGSQDGGATFSQTEKSTPKIKEIDTQNQDFHDAQTKNLKIKKSKTKSETKSKNRKNKDEIGTHSGENRRRYWNPFRQNRYVQISTTLITLGAEFQKLLVIGEQVDAPAEDRHLSAQTRSARAILRGDAQSVQVSVKHFAKSLQCHLAKPENGWVTIYIDV